MTHQDPMGIPLSKNEDPALEKVIDLMNRYDPDHLHAIQVEKIACMLFDTLISLHHLGPDERRQLSFAALLHDIGWSNPAHPHHKASMNLILEDQKIPVTSDERRIIALIARYHRKAHPSPDHYQFGLLSAKQRHQVEWCSALLRIADVLDRFHDSRVSAISLLVSDTKICIYCDCVDKITCPNLSPADILKKSALLSGISGREVEVKCNE